MNSIEKRGEVMPPVIIPAHVLDVIDALEPGLALDVQLTRLATHELRRRQAGYQLTDRHFRTKYGMTLEEFEAAGLVARYDYSFEVESDHQDWDLAIDGIRSIERQLAELRAIP